jgi:hypothetical protein
MALSIGEASNNELRTGHFIFLSYSCLVAYNFLLGNLPNAPQLSHGVAKAEDRDARPPRASGKSLLEQFRDYDL